MDTVSLLSINRADATRLTVGRSVRRTGHVKLPQEGRIQIEEQGIAGDFIGNLKFHGGADQAIYLYSAQDILWWGRLLGRPLEPGFFGENLTIDSWWPDARVGDRLRCGGLLLELTGPRTPCATLEARAGVPGLARQFVKAERSGAYARVLQAGAVQAGDSLKVTRTMAPWPTIADVFRYWHAKGDDAAFLEAALASPIAERIADSFRSRLAACQANLLT